KIVEDNLSVRETETLARLYGTQGLPRSKRPVSPRSFKIVARKLRQQLSTSVRVKNVRGKNRIEIEFKDEEDLQRIFNLLEPSQTTDNVDETEIEQWEEDIESDEQDLAPTFQA
ncbi:MAG: hypothetical protein FWH50_03395, partial [Coriobacteriia bacterium]|nr:hypothetical protein [Coriobacteriia bacterium]